MVGTRLLNGIRQAPQVVPAGGDVDRLTEGRLDEVGDLLACPFPLVVWRRLKSQIQRFALDLVEQKRVAGTTRATVCQTVRALGVVQRDGVGQPTWTSLHDARHVAACPEFRLAKEEQGVPAGAFVIVRRRFVPVSEFFNAQMGSDRYGFDPDTLTRFRIRGLISRSFFRRRAFRKDVVA